MPRCLLRRLAGVLTGILASAVAALMVVPAVHAADDDAFLLVANPGLVDIDYRQTVLIAAPSPSGGHVGVILNRPTRRSLGSLFPEHEPSKKVLDPVFYGGPFARGAVVAIVKTQADPGNGSIALMKDLYLAFRASVIDTVIEATPNDARYYVGYVGWRPGELKREIERGLWGVLDADRDTPFRKNTDGLWEEMLQQSRRLHVEAPDAVDAALYASLPEAPNR